MVEVFVLKKIIKNISKILFSLILLVSVFSTVKILAEEAIFKITKIEVEEISDKAIINDISISDGSLKNDIGFTDKNDYVKYKITIKNTSKTDYTIKSITDDNESPYLKYEYDNLSNQLVKSGEEKYFELKISYVKTTNNLQITDKSVSLTLTYDKYDGSEIKEVITKKENDATNGKYEIIDNPKTSDELIKYTILSVVALLGLAFTTVKRKKLSKSIVVIMFLGMVTIPLGAKANEFKFLIVFNNDIKVNDSADLGTVQDYQDINDNEGVINILSEVLDESSLKTVYEHKGSCTFNGTDGITGEECEEYLGQSYIDTKVKLYDELNYPNDYEIGFTIEDFDYTKQEYQATLFNCKYENVNRGYPGALVRVNGTVKSSLEISHVTNFVRSNPIVDSSGVKDIRIIKNGNKYYYSINNGNYVLFHVASEPADLIDNTVWFGAAQNINGKPMRYFRGTLSNMYIKVGKHDLNGYTVTFDGNGGYVEEEKRFIGQFDTLGSLPILEREGYKFIGWYTDPINGEKVFEDEYISSDRTIYAHWKKYSVKMNGNYYDTIQEAINKATSETTTITLLDDVYENNIKTDKNIILNVGNYTITNDTGKYPVITNKGNLVINNGTIVSNADEGIINNNSASNITINNVSMYATGTKQVLYNTGGNVTIKGNSYLSNKSTNRSALHNVSGNTKILSGTVVSSNNDAIKIEKGTLTLGEKDNIYNPDSILIQGKTGINTSVGISVYDGTIRGEDIIINNENKITSIEDDSNKVKDIIKINEISYKTLYYVINN